MQHGCARQNRFLPCLAWSQVLCLKNGYVKAVAHCAILSCDFWDLGSVWYYVLPPQGLSTCCFICLASSLSLSCRHLLASSYLKFRSHWQGKLLYPQRLTNPLPQHSPSHNRSSMTTYNAFFSGETREQNLCPYRAHSLVEEKLQ